MELFTYMDDDVYQMAMTHSKENPFRNYLEYLRSLNELTADQKKVYQGSGRDFLNLLEVINMSKIYKMPVLMAFYNYGDVKLEVTEEDLLQSWKNFFKTGKNWRDLEKKITYEDFLKISDKQHIKKILQMPVHFLLQSGKGFFVEKEGAALGIRADLQAAVQSREFAEQMKDIIEYRTMAYYQRRYRNEE